MNIAITATACVTVDGNQPAGDHTEPLTGNPT